MLGHSGLILLGNLQINDLGLAAVKPFLLFISIIILVKPQKLQYFVFPDQ